MFLRSSWIDFPTYVFNKVLSLSALILFVLNHFYKNKKRINSSNFLQEFAIIFVLLHVLISFIVLTPNYFSKFFAESKFNLTGGLSILFGILAIGFLLPLINKSTFKEIYNRFNNKKFVANIFFVLTTMHVLVMGFKGWFEPQTWPGGLPPITLISFISAISPLFFRIKN